jgi:methylglutamate dehydrogenase subunit D
LLIDVSDSRIAVRISGASARDVLAKGLPIDLHPSTMRAGDVAATVVAHVQVLVWQVNDAPTYELICA